MQQIKWQQQNGIKDYNKDEVSPYELGTTLETQKKQFARKNWKNRIKNLSRK